MQLKACLLLLKHVVGLRPFKLQARYVRLEITDVFLSLLLVKVSFIVALYLLEKSFFTDAFLEALDVKAEINRYCG